MITIRRATTADVEQLLDMGEAFIAATAYKAFVTANRGRMGDVIAGVLARADGAVFVSARGDRLSGMIGGLIYAHPFSGEPTAFEMFWWTSPDDRRSGVRLLRALERWAREQGATHMQMVAPDARVGAFYERVGYTPVETSYQRAL